MPAKIRAVDEAVTRLLKEYAVKKLPVPLDAIAKSHAFVQRDKLPADISGMLVPNDPDARKRWIIVINKDHALTRQRFTMAHELGHLLLHEYKTPHADGPQTVRFRDGKSAMGSDREEIEANQFAAEILMPAYLVIPELQRLGLDSWDGSSNGEIADKLSELAKKCVVSEQALVLRIATLLH